MSDAYHRSVPIRRVRHPMEDSPLWGILGTIIFSALAMVISLPLLLVFLAVLPFKAAIKWILLGVYQRRHSQYPSIEPMWGSEACWFAGGSQRSVFHAILVLDGGKARSLEKFQRVILSQVLPVYPRLTSVPLTLPLSAGGRQCWVPDSQFSIARHVKQGPSELRTKEDLKSYVASLIQTELPTNKPPWEFYVISPSGELTDSVIVARIHQSIADGTTLLRILYHALADNATIDLPERPQFGYIAFGLNVFRACLIGPCMLLIWLWLTASDCNPLTRRCNWTGSVTVTWSASITLPKVMRIKQVTRSTVNCVILSALAGALRVLLQGCGVRQPPNVKILVPMDIRSQRASQLNSTSLGNKSASVVLPLPVSVEGCVPRLWATRQTLESLKSSVDPVLLYMATSGLMTVSSATTVCYLLDILANKTSIQFSSIPGPTTQLSVGGERLKEIYCILPAAANVGISVTAITYGDDVSVSVAAEAALGPAAKMLLTHLEDQVEILWKLLLNRRVPGENRTAYFGFSRDIIDSPIQEIEERLSAVQKEVVRLSDENLLQEDDKLLKLKAEFAQLVGELKRRQSLGDRGKSEPDLKQKSRRRAFSCSMSTRQSAMSLKHILSSKPSSHVLEIEKGPAESLDSKRALVHIENESRRWKHAEPLKPPAEQFSKKYRKNSFELMRDQRQRKEFNTTVPKQEKVVIKDSESDDNTIDTETDYSDNTIKISDDESMDLGYDDFKTTGPINTNLRDLYCSNYLDYKLDLLRRKESLLSQQINEQSLAFYPDIEDADNDGVLI